ncbi:hypothetical protein D1610_15515 [Sphingomonas gilva]|uniref:Uncharacterized protein n=1 Tax=Sphingomonas gilva TaxID=2305907 RepID=A0A396RJW8_9SPHN|nr:hypothetical protein [Sphingomonas gilva]RHW16497.1 hypothetical protein D1610_15515 [Sphingomonas gilva]
MSWRQSTSAWPQGPSVSRAINVDADEKDVRAACARQSATISAIEPLLPSGTRVVLNNAGAAAKMRKAFGSKLLTGPVTRLPWGGGG